jgi:hypothetical protein
MAPAHQRLTQAFILGPHAATSQHKWKKFTQVQAVCQLQDKNKVQQISTQSVDSTPHYPSINDPCATPCFPPTLPKISPSLFHLVRILALLYLQLSRLIKIVLGFSTNFFPHGPVIITILIYLGLHPPSILVHSPRLLNQPFCSSSMTTKPIPLLTFSSHTIIHIFPLFVLLHSP